MSAPRLVWAIIVFLLGACAAAAEGEDATGDWGGARTWLDDHGVHLDLDYTAEVFGVVAGAGEGPRVAYRGTVDLILQLDSEKMSLWPGGRLFLQAQNGHGEGVSPTIQAFLLVSNLEAPPYTQVSELWLEQRFFGDRLRFKVGKQDANRDFAAPRFGGNFVNSSFGAAPSVPMPTFPAPGWAAVAFVDPLDWLGVRAGVYEGAPELERFGIDTSGVFAVAAVMVRHRIGDSERPEGFHQVGTWHHTGGDGSSGLFAVFDVRALLSPDDDGHERSLQVFLRLAGTPTPDSPVTFYAGGGVTLHGLRHNDTLGLGAGHARLAEGAETFLELFYKLRPVPWFTVEPDVQLFFRPDAALVAGLRLKIKL